MRSGCSPARCSPVAWRLTAPTELEQAIRATRELIANPEVPAIFEGTFENGGVLVRVDILQRRRDGRWRLLEVKSTTDLKEHHLDDVAIQARVVSRSGLDLAASCLMHVNRNYVFQGGSIDVTTVLPHPKPDPASQEVAAQAHVPAAGGVHRPRHAESAGHYLRDAIALSPSPASSSTAAIRRARTTTSATCPNPGERGRGAGGDWRRVDPRHPGRLPA